MPDRLTDRVTAWTIRSVALAMLFAGGAILVAGVPLIGRLGESPVVRSLAGIVLQLGGVLAAAGAAALYLSRPHGLTLPNERAASGGGRPAVGGWLIALAVVLVALPVWLVLRLQPFLAEWRRVIAFLATPGLWEGANANGAGLVLVPLAGALTPPLLELAAMLSFVVASPVLLMLLLSRSRRFPRLYLVCVVLLGGLVIASVRGAEGAMLAAKAVERLVDSSSGSAEETAQLKQGLDRYTSIVGSAAPALVGTLCGYLLWVPALVFSPRVRSTFAGRRGGRAATRPRVIDVEAITTPPRFPG